MQVAGRTFILSWPASNCCSTEQVGGGCGCLSLGLSVGRSRRLSGEGESMYIPTYVGCSNKFIFLNKQGTWFGSFFYSVTMHYCLSVLSINYVIVIMVACHIVWVAERDNHY